jgi:hypothetical protein
LKPASNLGRSNVQETNEISPGGLDSWAYHLERIPFIAEFQEAKLRGPTHQI